MVTLAHVSSKWLSSTLPWQCSSAGQLEWKLFSFCQQSLSVVVCHGKNHLGAFQKCLFPDSTLKHPDSRSLGNEPVFITIFPGDDHSGGLQSHCQKDCVQHPDMAKVMPLRECWSMSPLGQCPVLSPPPSCRRICILPFAGSLYVSICYAYALCLLCFFQGKIPQLQKQGHLLVILCFNWQMTYQGHAIEISICILPGLQFPSAWDFLDSLLGVCMERGDKSRCLWNPFEKSSTSSAWESNSCWTSRVFRNLGVLLIHFCTLDFSVEEDQACWFMRMEGMNSLLKVAISIFAWVPFSLVSGCFRLYLVTS